MKRLFEIIESLELQIPKTASDKLPDLYLSIATHLDLVNGKKQRHYLNKILENNTLDAYHEIRIKAEILMAGVVLNQMQTVEALTMAENALAKAQQIQNEKLIIEAKLQQSIALQYNGKPEAAASVVEMAIAASTTLNQPELLRASYNYASLIYTDKDMLRSGNYAMNALKYAQQIGKKWLIGYNHAILGFWAMANKVDKDRYFHFTEAAKYLEPEGADEYYAVVLIELSTCEKDRKNFDTALQHLAKAQDVFYKVENMRLATMNAIAMGRLLRAQKKYDQSEQHFKQAIALATEHHIEHENAAANALLAHLYRDMEQPHKAIFHFEKAIEILGDRLRPSFKADIAKFLHSIYYKTGNLEKAYTTLLNYTEIRLQLQDENRIKETAQLQTKYEAEKREAELREAKLQQTESELKALKAQMNPHFIFNALNSIQEIFFMGDKRLANKHLSRFSQLMRSILRASGKKTITLQEEINMLQEYLTLEALRFGNEFQFQINAEHDVDTYTLDVPPMIIQPFVENAVKHGLLHKAGDQKVDINFSFNQEQNAITVTVKDNGIGRQVSAEINKHRSHHESFSTSATQKRFEILNQQAGRMFSFTYNDLQTTTGAAAGTEVTIIIPVEN
jgi:two-component sensor histidine kinase